MTTRDGVRLDADVYVPETDGSFPVLLMRQPYGREIASTVVYAHPAWYASHGFIVVIQDVRGRGTSEGEFRLFEHEATDGFDTVAWAAKLPQSNGRVGMYGFSYQGMTQLLAAQLQPPPLRAIAPAMVGYRPHCDWAYEQGALLLQGGVGWAIQLAAETARLRGDRSAFQALYQASRHLPLHDEVTACPAVLRDHAPDSFWHDWVAHPHGEDPYWQRITPQLAAVDLPMLHIGGWFDPYLRGDLQLYQEMAARSRYPQPLWIGPWSHLPWGPVVGARDFGPAANSPIDRLQVQWFRQHLQIPTAAAAIAEERLQGSTATLFEMGSNIWRSFPAWPQGQPMIWVCESDGLAGVDQRDGRLRPLDAMAGDQALATMATDWLVHDPWRPVPSIGGHAAIPAGCFDRAGVDCRSDVLTYTSEPLSMPLSVAGIVTITLQGSCDRPSFDLSVTLSERLPTGQVYPLTQGYRRCDRPTQVDFIETISLQPTCFYLPAGHALRLSISAACFPAYALNPGTGAYATDTTVQSAQIITLAIHTGYQSGTRLSLPLSQPHHK